MNATTSGTSEVPGISVVPEDPANPEAPTMEQRLRAIDTLLADPEAIPDPLEVELYAYREQITGETVG